MRRHASGHSAASGSAAHALRARPVPGATGLPPPRTACSPRRFGTASPACSARGPTIRQPIARFEQRLARAPYQRQSAPPAALMLAREIHVKVHHHTPRPGPLFPTPRRPHASSHPHSQGHRDCRTSRTPHSRAGIALSWRASFAMVASSGRGARCRPRSRQSRGLLPSRSRRTVSGAIRDAHATCRVTFHASPAMLARHDSLERGPRAPSWPDLRPARPPPAREARSSG